METVVELPKEETPAWLRLVAGKNPGWTLVRVLVAVLICVGVFKFAILPIRVTGSSMSPTLKNGQIKFVNRLAYLRQAPQRGDIVAVQFAGKQAVLLKRVIALPGETLQVIRGVVYINGERLEEPYASGKIPPDTSDRGLGSSSPRKMEPDQYWLDGDNRAESEHFLKYRHQIIGKLL